jgi:hypothetical protein
MSAYGRRTAGSTAPQIRSSLHHLLVERHLAWNSSHQVAAELQCLSLHQGAWLKAPPAQPTTAHGTVATATRVEPFSAQHSKPRALLMTTFASGLRGSEVVPL